MKVLIYLHYLILPILFGSSTDHRLRLVFRKASTQTQPILLRLSAENVVPLPGLIDSTDWQNASGVQAEDGDCTSPGSHLACARCVVWTIIFELGLVAASLL
jgi:hypothetical protein